MKIGILSDIHGNSVALYQAIQYLKIKNVKRFFFLGDYVGYLPDVNEVIDFVKNYGEIAICGNHEAMLLNRISTNADNERVYKHSAAKSIITTSNLEYITNLESSQELFIEGKKILLVHGSPNNPLCGYIYIDFDLTKFSTLSYDFVFMGHTHRPFIKKEGSSTFVNVGSCGLPIYDSQLGKADIHRLQMDTFSVMNRYSNQVHEDVIKKILAT
jgi:putative phosphoesterase